MAASPKQTKSVDPRIAHSLLTRFQQLGCPFTDGVEESWITELVFKPGEQRIRLLQWLFYKVDSQLQDVLEPYHTSSDSRIDSRIQKLLFVATSLGLCRYDDVDLIKGVVSISRQTAFMDQLLDMACILDEAENAQKRAMSSPGIINVNTSLEEQFEGDCYLLDALASSENLAFSTKVNILPADIKKTVETSWLDKGHSPSEWPLVPDLSQVVLVAEDLAKNVSHQSEILEELCKKFPYPTEDPQGREKVNKAMRLVLSELAQIITGFSYCFENHVRQWCNKSAPRLTELGPAFKRVHLHLDHMIKLLASLNTIRTSVTKLDQTDMPLSANRSSEEHIKTIASMGEETVGRFQDCISILEESICRGDETATNSFTGSVLSVT